MNAQLSQIDAVLVRIERLATELSADADGHVRRSVNELRVAFEARGRMEPAVARVRTSVLMLRRFNREGSRREFQRRSHGVDRLDRVIEQELLPNLRRVGFEV